MRQDTGAVAVAYYALLSLVPMMILATCVAVLASLAGLYVSYYAKTAAGASVALALVAAYLLALLGRWAADVAGRRLQPA